MNAVEFLKQLLDKQENFEKGWSHARVTAEELALLGQYLASEQAAAEAATAKPEPAVKTTKATKATAQTTTTEDNADAA